ncbi:MAG: hypothetical protein JRD89_01615 [Deltaproteobacteria bacterium]|nr:hypothetical protein [Deltaproteobacteria bacterium]
MCKRKWAFAKIDRVPKVQHPSAILGGEVHIILEDYLKQGKAPDRETKQGKIALAGIHLLPAPGTVEVEGRFKWELADQPFDLQGVVDYSPAPILVLPPDYLNPKRSIWKPHPAPGLVPVVGDHKTTGDWKWAPSPEELLTMIQPTIYAQRKMQELGVDSCLVEYIYYLTKGTPKSKAVRALFTLADNKKIWEGILAKGREMVYILETETEAKNIEPNPQTCPAYGGCQHRGRCKLTNGEIMRSYMSKPTLREQMAENAKAVAAAGGTPAAVVAAINPPAEAAPPAKLSVMDNMKAKAAAKAATPPTAMKIPDDQAPAPAAPAPAPAAPKMTTAALTKGAKPKSDMVAKMAAHKAKQAAPKAEVPQVEAGVKMPEPPATGPKPEPPPPPPAVKAPKDKKAPAKPTTVVNNNLEPPAIVARGLDETMLYLAKAAKETGQKMTFTITFE